MNLKENIDYLMANKKYLLIYLILIAIFTFVMFGPKNYQFWGFEAISIPAITIIGIITIIYSFKKELDIHKVALILIIVFGLLMVFLAPPMSYPDEAIHFSRAELLSEGVLSPQETDQGFLVNNYFFGLNEAQKGLTIFDNPQIFNPITNSKGFMPKITESPFYSYIFSAIGILLAKTLHLTAIFALFFARIGNLLLYAGVAYYAIKKAPAFKIGLTVIATMPLVISQVSSTSYDAFIFTFTLLIMAYFIKMYKDKAENKDLAVFFISILLISLIKPPYIILTLLILAIPKGNFITNRNYSFIVVIFMFIITFLSFNGLLSSILSTSTATTVTTATSNISVSGQSNFVINNPLILIDLIKNVIVSIPSMFVLDLSFFHYADFKGLKIFNLAYLLFFIVFSLLYKQDINLSKTKRTLLSLIFIVVYFGIYGILYLIWTPIGSNIILGVQARYFIPIIAFLPLIINYDKKSKEEYKYLMMLIVTFLVGLILLTITHYY